MARERLSMRKIAEVLRLSLEQGLSVRQIAASCQLARSTVADYLGRARVAGLSWPLPEGIDEDRLEAMLFPAHPAGVTRASPNMVYMYGEMRRKHVTLQLLWEEYRAATPDGYGYSQYCQRYRDWVGKQAISLRQEHRAGEKLFIDFAGDWVAIHDPLTGEVAHGRLFVAVLGCSNYTYAEVLPGETLADWVTGTIHALEYFGGVPEIVVPDNPRAVVNIPCRYEPDINRTFHDVGEHYSFAVIPARPRKPKDKAKVETGVLIAQRWILARMRDQRFFSVGDANTAIRGHLTRLNERSFKKLPGCRKSVFEQVERATLKALPERPYELAWWKKATAGIDYHVALEGHYYSVPFTLAQHAVDVRYSRASVELFHKGRRVAVHVRSTVAGRFTTIPEHMAPAHAAHTGWTPGRMTSWAEKVGPQCKAVAMQMMGMRKMPEYAYRACLGVMRLGKRYGTDRLEQACALALKMNIVGYRHIDSILKTGRDRLCLEDIQQKPSMEHANLRGSAYYN